MSWNGSRTTGRPAHYRPELQWLCGLEIVNHHSLSEFRVKNTEALEAIFTQAPALLSQEGLIDLMQVTVDGTRVRAQASPSSERRRPTIERHLEQAQKAVRRLSQEADSEDGGRRRQAAQ